jgi:hypothetical protein
MDMKRHEYYIRHKDTLLESYKKFYYQNRERLLKKKKEYRRGLGNRERLTKIQRNYLFRRKIFKGTKELLGLPI